MIAPTQSQRNADLITCFRSGQIEPSRFYQLLREEPGLREMFEEGQPKEMERAA